MDNFRVTRPTARPRVALDGFTRATAARQTAYRGEIQRPAAAQPVASSPAQPYVQPTPVPQPFTAAPQPQPVEQPNPLMPPTPHSNLVARVSDADFTPPPMIPHEPHTVPAPQPASPQEAAAEAQHVQVTPFDIDTIEESDIPKNRLSAGRAFKKWALRSGIATLVLLIAVGGTLFAQGYGKVHQVFRGNDSKSTAATASAVQQLLKGEDTGRVNVLLLGNGGDGHQAPDLTDTLIVASVDVVHHTAVMLSIPRDLWVQVPEYGNMKINATYEVGKYNSLGKIDDSNANTKAVFAGFKQADQAVAAVTGLRIDYNVLVNFKSFKQAIDAVGGITLNVPQDLVDPTMAWENHHNPVLAKAGVQQMTGSQALLYVRSRETSSDFARSQRQRSVILSLKDKVLTAGTLSNPLKISQLINAFGDNLVTDMSLSEGMRAYNIGKSVDNAKVTSLDLVTPPNNLITTGNMNGVSIDQPRAGLFQYSAIQQYIQQALAASSTPPAQQSTTTGSNAAAKPESATISVLNGTATAGLAAAKGNVIKGAGYNVVAVGNAPSKGYTKTVVVDLSNGANSNTKSYLEKAFATTAVTALPAGISAGGANFVVILGSEQSL